MFPPLEATPLELILTEEVVLGVRIVGPITIKDVKPFTTTVCCLTCHTVFEGEDEVCCSVVVRSDSSKKKYLYISKHKSTKISRSFDSKANNGKSVMATMETEQSV